VFWLSSGREAGSSGKPCRCSITKENEWPTPCSSTQNPPSPNCKLRGDTEGLHPPHHHLALRLWVNSTALLALLRCEFWAASYYTSSKRSYLAVALCCAVNFNLFVFHKFVISVSCVKLLCGDMEDQPETSSAVTTPVKLDKLRKSAIRSQNKRTIYNVCKFLKDISEQLGHSVI
jgi:hypothetical protein